MRLLRLAEDAYLVTDLPEGTPGFRLARAVRQVIGSTGGPVQEVVASYDSVGLVLGEHGAGVESTLERLIQQAEQVAEELETATHRIPVCYRLGADLETCAKQLGLDPEDLAQKHSMHEYTCFSVGFSPGFPYLGYLPEKLRGVDRLGSPRVRVEPGSVGITGDQTGIYPSATPGGWRIVGRTPLTLVAPEENYFPIQPGDVVTFHAIDEAEFEKLKGERL